MTLVCLKLEDRAEVEVFLSQYEASCAFLMERFLCGGDSIYALRDQRGVRGIFFCSNSGMIFHCFPFPSEFEHYRKLLIDFFSTRKIFCVNGEVSGSLFLLKLFTEAGLGVPHQINRYFLMTREYGKNDTFGYSDNNIDRCFEKDTDALMPLEAGYQKEEVLPDNLLLNLPFCRMQLQRVLTKQFVFAVRADNSPDCFVAKAGTNAVCRNWAQLGGVYTLPAYRCRGYGCRVLLTVVRFMAQQKKNCVLFVNKKNLAAFRLYEKNGFTISGHYIIAYY